MLPEKGSVSIFNIYNVFIIIHVLMNMKHGRVSEAKYLQVKLRVYNVCVYSIVL